MYFACCMLKAIVNSTVLPNMSFAKTSQKFGQWADTRVNTVYGLGFNSEMELTKVSVNSFVSSNICIFNLLPKKRHLNCG